MKTEAEQAQEAWNNHINELYRRTIISSVGSFLVGRDDYKAALNAEIEKRIERYREQLKTAHVDNVHALKCLISECKAFLSLLDTVNPDKMKTLPKKIVLTITKEDCIGTDFSSCENCAVAKSFKRIFGDMEVSEGVDCFSAGRINYNHAEFTDVHMDDILKTGKSRRLVLIQSTY